MDIYKLTPHIERKIWGGSYFSQYKSLSGDDIGELWEVSTLKQGVSRCVGGGPLSQVAEELDFLIKFLDTTDNLSVQVHPGDQYALQVENSKGKSECWLILSAEPGAGVYLGLKEGIEKSEFEQYVANNRDLSQILNFFPVSAGCFFFVPAGTIHAIGAGVRLLEVQQSSGITYRVWDWNRVDKSGKSRPLHIEKAFECINFEHDKNRQQYFRIKTGLFEKNQLTSVLVEHCDFKVQLITMMTGQKQVINKNQLNAFVCLSGGCKVDTIKGSLELGKFESAISLGLNDVTIEALADLKLVVVS